MFPEYADAFQENPFAVFRCFRPHQLCRTCGEFFVACRDRRHAGAGCTRQNRKASLLPVQRGHVIRESGIQHAVGIHNNPGQDFFSNHHARESAGYGGEHRVCEIFKGDHAVGIAEGF